MSFFDSISDAVSELGSDVSGAMLANETRYTLTVAAADTLLQVLSFEITEELNEPWTLIARVVTENSDLQPEKLLHSEMTLKLTGHSGDNYYHGQVWRCKKKAQGKRLTQYELICKPNLAWLGLGQNQRIFQQKTEREIIDQILREQRIPSDRVLWQLSGTYQPRDYCVQYQESDLTFITRLCCEAGFCFFFHHEENQSQIVFADHPAAWNAELEPVAYKPGTGQSNEADTLLSFTLQHQVGVQSVFRRQFDFQKPRHLQDTKHQNTDSTQSTPDYLTHYFCVSANRNDHASTTQAQQHLQALQRELVTVDGRGSLPQLRTGYRLSVTQHPRQDVNRDWLITRLTMKGEQPQVLEEFSAGQSSLSCHFSGIPGDLFWRPDFQPAKPILKGIQTALVTGPKGEEIYTDAMGRIKVQFYWDRKGQRDNNTSCWLRVMHDWAGNGYGITRLPRIGQEVQISFEDGNPDKPLITGMHHNAEQPTAWQQPKHKTRSGIRTSSTPDGVGTNELRFEDKKGHEELRWQAQQDWDVLIKADSHIQIDGSHEREVSGNDFREVHGEQHLRLEANDHKKIGKNQHITIHGNAEQHIEQKSRIQANQSIGWKSQNKAIFHAGTEITLKVGGSFIKLDPSGVTLSGSSVSLNQGGSVFSAGVKAAELPIKPARVHESGIGKMPEVREPEKVVKVESKKSFPFVYSD